MSDATPATDRPAAAATTPGDRARPDSAERSRVRTGVVFVSHEKSDEGLAREIRSHLETGGLACWMAPDDIRGPTPWPEQVEHAIETCDVMLIIVSQNSGSSHHVSREVDLAVELGKPLLPVRVEDVAPTGTLNYLLRLAQWIDLFPGPIADHAASLHTMVDAMLTGHRGTRPTPPQPEPTPRRSIRRIRIPTGVLVALGIAAILAIGLAIGLILGNSGNESDEPTTEPVAATPTATVEDPTEQPEPPVSEEPIDTPAPGTVAPTSTPPAGKGTITRISAPAHGIAANDHSANPVISADGRFVAYDSHATNLVDNDSGQWRDVFLHDRETGETIRVSELREVNGEFREEGAGSSREPRISADGAWVVFVSDADNLDLFPEENGFDTNEASDVWLWNRETRLIARVSVTPEGADHDLNSVDPSMSDDGTLIAYATYAGDQTPLSGSDTGPYTVWVHDALTGVTSLVKEIEPTEGIDSSPTVSADGSTVAFNDHGDGVHLFDPDTSELRVVDRLERAVWVAVALSHDGNQIFFSSLLDNLVPDDINGLDDIFVYDLTDESVAMIFENPGPPGPAMQSLTTSSDGHCIAFVHGEGGWPGVVCGGDEFTRFDFIDTVAFDIDGAAKFATFSSIADEYGTGLGNGKQDVFAIQLQD